MRQRILKKLLISRLNLVYYKLSHIPTVKVNTHLTIISTRGKMKGQPIFQPKDITIEIIAGLSYNKQNIGVVIKSSSEWGGAWI